MADNPDLCPGTQRKHYWILFDVRTLQGVRPPITAKEWQCEHCRDRKTTEDPLI